MLRQQLAESQQTAEALRGSGVEARAQAQEYGERARRAETLNQEHSADLASLRYLVFDCRSAFLLGSKGLSNNVGMDQVKICTMVSLVVLQQIQSCFGV